jgi:hypothetical protein
VCANTDDTVPFGTRHKEKTMQQYDTRLITVPDWPKYHPWPPVGGLRHLIFHADANGFHAVVRRCGRRVLIDETAFFAWMKGDRLNEAPKGEVIPRRSRGER